MRKLFKMTGRKFVPKVIFFCILGPVGVSKKGAAQGIAQLFGFIMIGLSFNLDLTYMLAHNCKGTIIA